MSLGHTNVVPLRPAAIDGALARPAAVGKATLDDLRASFERGRMRPIAERRRQLRSLLRLLRHGEADIVTALEEDLGRGTYEAWAGEIAPVRAEAKHALRRLRRWTRPERVRLPLALRPARARVRSEPLGVVLVMGPWNYPVQLLLKPLVSALAAGNCAVLKPSESAPAASACLARLVERHLDPQIVRVVEGGRDVGRSLARLPFDHIYFTGGIAAGSAVLQAAAELLVPVTLELGGKNPCFVDRSADVEVAARRIVWGKFLNAGQTCVAPDHVLVHRDRADELMAALRARILHALGPDPRFSPDYGRIVHSRHLARLRRLLEGTEVVHGGDFDEVERYLAPTLVWNPDPDSPIMAEEIFGPVLPVVPVDDLQEALAWLRERPTPLAVYLFSGDRSSVRAFEDSSRSGGLVVNDVVVQAMSPELPFGGLGMSGMGAGQGKAGFDTFSHRRAVVERSQRFDPDQRYRPWSARKLRWARRLL
jgi:acyl-CoA reductase-like NAD-dependent aldehyde dehydrogenase